MIQIIGRFRNGLNRITHITNSFNDYTYRSKEDVLREVNTYEVCYKFTRRNLTMPLITVLNMPSANYLRLPCSTNFWMPIRESRIVR